MGSSTSASGLTEPGRPRRTRMPAHIRTIVGTETLEKYVRIYNKAGDFDFILGAYFRDPGRARLPRDSKSCMEEIERCERLYHEIREKNRRRAEEETKPSPEATD